MVGDELKKMTLEGGVLLRAFWREVRFWGTR
jgi:hypothetical protein